METPDSDLQHTDGTAARTGETELFKNFETRPLPDMPLKRVCFVLQVKPDRLAEYKQRHRAVWPEMLDALRKTGWTNYSLFLRDDGLLIGYLEAQNFERTRAAIARLEVNKRWQSQMADFFMQPDGFLPDQAIVPLEEIFHL